MSLAFHSLPFSPHTNLQNVEAHVRPDGAVVRMRLLVGVHVEQADSFVGLQAPFLEEDQQGTRSANLQVVRQQVGYGLANQRAGRDVVLHVAQLQGSGAKLHTHMDSITPELSTKEEIDK